MTRCLNHLSNGTAFFQSEPYIPGAIGILVMYVLLLGIGFISIWLGKRQRNRLAMKTSPKDHAMLADRNMSTLVGIFSLTATFVDGAFINSIAETIFNPHYGLVWIQAPIFIAVGCWLSIVFAAKTKKSGYTTILDPLEIRYGQVHTVFIFLTMLLVDLLWMGALLLSLGTSLSVIIGINYRWAVILSAGVSTLYTMIGGLYPVVYTDVLQLTLTAVGLVVPIPFALQHEAVTDITITAQSETSWLGHLDGPAISLYIDLALLFTLSCPIYQVYYQRVFALRSGTKGAIVLSIVSGFWVIALAVPSIIIGSIASSTDWNATGYRYIGEIPVQACDYALALPMVLRFLTPKAVGVVGIVALSTAVLSSLDTGINAQSTMFANNVYVPLRNAISGCLHKGTKATSGEMVWAMRLSGFIIGAVSVAIALTGTSIYGLFVIAYDLAYCVLFPQVLCMLFVPFTNFWGAVVGFWVGWLLRLLAGEPSMNLPVTIKFPLYDEESQTQMFPFRTLITAVQLLVILLVSVLARAVCGAENPRCCTAHKMNLMTEADMSELASNVDSARTPDACTQYGIDGSQSDENTLETACTSDACTQYGVDDSQSDEDKLESTWM